MWFGVLDAMLAPLAVPAGAVLRRLVAVEGGFAGARARARRHGAGDQRSDHPSVCPPTGHQQRLLGSVPNGWLPTITNGPSPSSTCAPRSAWRRSRIRRRLLDGTDPGDMPDQSQQCDPQTVVRKAA